MGSLDEAVSDLVVASTSEGDLKNYDFTENFKFFEDLSLRTPHVQKAF